MMNNREAHFGSGVAIVEVQYLRCGSEHPIQEAVDLNVDHMVGEVAIIIQHGVKDTVDTFLGE